MKIKTEKFIHISGKNPIPEAKYLVLYFKVI